MPQRPNRAGWTADQQGVWAFAPGHPQTARAHAEAFAAEHGRLIHERPPTRAMLLVAPAGRAMAPHEVFVFRLAPLAQRDPTAP